MTTRPIVLIVDDESRIRRLAGDHLEAAGFDVCLAQNGREALDVFRLSSVEPDVVVLDLMMPEMDGHEMLAALRRTSNVPVIVLTARDFLSDKRKAFELGADDYLTKPFSLEELELRVRALLRRSHRSENNPPASISNGPLTLSPSDAAATWADQSVPLTGREYRLLEALVKRPGHIVRYEALLQIGWADREADVSHLRVAFARIRRKLSDLGAHPHIIASYTNVGYMIADLSHYEEDYGAEAVETGGKSSV